MDPMVLIVQQWVNNTYAVQNGFILAPENGKTGWSTMYSLTRALQIELGIATPANNFGEGTSSAYKAWGEMEMGSVPLNQQGQNIVKILQGAMYCKGYDPTGFTGTFGEGTKSAVTKLQTDAGLPIQDGKVYDYVFKAFLVMDAYVLTLGGDPRIREIQRNLNYNYFMTSGVQPADGHYQRGTNKALIYGIQTEEGIAPDLQTGSVGPTTRERLPTLMLGNRGNFVKLFQYALYFNRYDPGVFDGIYGNGVKNAVMGFQEFVALSPVDGIAGKQTWLSAITSTGDTSRRGTACDSVTMITPERATTLKTEGYEIIGRYLTNARNGVLNKKIQIGELQTIFDANLRVFPIFQTYGGDASYFNFGQGGRDAIEAYYAAESHRFKDRTTIYFAVDFDAYDNDVDNNILPHFRAIESEFYALGGKYKVGVYGPRNICIRVSEAGYATKSFVSGMSTGFSGNLGYPLPQNWAFDQIATITVGSGRGLITIDKNIASGLDAGQSLVEPINHKDGLDSTLILTYLPMIREEVPPIIKDILNFLQEFSSIREPIDSVNIVLDYDGLITRMARKLQMRKSFIQTVISWEASAENSLDAIQDQRVKNGDIDDSSTGVGQIFAWVAINARNWAINQNYLDDTIRDANNKDDINEIWHKLHIDRAFNIETCAYVLKWGAVVEKGYPSNMLNYTESQVKGTIARYNGTNESATKYGERNYTIYQAFENYNQLSR